MAQKPILREEVHASSRPCTGKNMLLSPPRFVSRAIPAAQGGFELYQVPFFFFSDFRF
jgi:hypothetical protein